MTFALDFMGRRHIATVVSIVLVLVSIGSVAFVGLQRGLDFTGGVEVELGFPAAVEIARVRAVLADAGFDSAVVQSYGAQTDILVRMPPVEGVDQSDLGNRVAAALAQAFDGVSLRRNDFVGPSVGEELTENGGLALLVALGVVMFYIMWRFTGKFSVGAVTALVHDVVIVVGAFSVCGWTFNLPELAALLAVIGYSLNDTIVVSDRIRENFRAMRRGHACRDRQPLVEPDHRPHSGDFAHDAARARRPAFGRRRAGGRVRHGAQHRRGGGHLLVDLRRRQCTPRHGHHQAGPGAAGEGGRGPHAVRRRPGGAP